MIEINPRKNKINLADYDYESDIKNRVLLSRFTDLDFEVLEEVLFNSVRFPISDISRNLEIRMDDLNQILEKLKITDLFLIEGEHLVVNKEARRYFELQTLRFDEEFNPGMEFLQQLLKIIPIHILPNWYHIPRTSDNIFDSLVEKYLITPQIFQRHLMDLNLGNPTINQIISELFSTKNLRLPTNYIKVKYNLNDETLQEYILLLEYNFVCSLKYEKSDSHWEGYLTPFKEWKEYLTFLNSTKPSSIEDEVVPFRMAEYAFSEDMANLLRVTKVKPITVSLGADKKTYLMDPEHLRLVADALQHFDVSHEKRALENYLGSLIGKLLKLRLATVQNNYFKMTEEATDWLNLPSEKRALHTYKHPLNQLSFEVDKTVCTDKNIREIEKSISRIVKLDWVYLEEFMKGLIVPLNDRTKITLQKTGKNWRYTIPEYSDIELQFIKSTLMDWLFESGIIQTGRHHGKPCFKVTSLGKILFGE